MGNRKKEMVPGKALFSLFPIPLFLDIHPRSSASIGGLN
jgi:hypothetical protein